MAEEKQPAGIVEGATTGDVEDEIQDTAKSAEDRKAAAALSKLDARDDELGPSKDVDQEGLSRAMNKLEVSKKTEETRDLKKVKVDAADVALLVSLLARKTRPRPRFPRVFEHALTQLCTGRRTRIVQAQGYRPA